MESTETTVDEIVAEQAAIVAVVEETAATKLDDVEVDNLSSFHKAVADKKNKVSPATLQAEMENTRKEMGLSRRALADSVGWTESRVWYLGQPGVRLDVERNVADIAELVVHMIELRAAGWTKPTVKSTARAAKTTEDTFTKDQVDELLAAATKGLDDLRAKHDDQLAALRQTVQIKIDEAKAKKAGTAALVAIQGMIDDMVWES